MADEEKHQEPVGSVADEAAKLLGALGGWMNDAEGGSPRPGSEEFWHGLDEHVATGSAECLYCPVCRAIGAVRDLSPEVRTHLTTAASSLLQAATAVFAAAGAHQEHARRREESVEKIDLDEGDDWEDD